MGLVVGRVQILAIPARWEEDLSSKAVRAVVIRKHGSFGFCRTIVVKTTVTHALGCEVVATGPLVGITCEHAEAGGECFQCLAIAGTLQIVDSGASNLIHAFESAVLMLEI